MKMKKNLKIKPKEKGKDLLNTLKGVPARLSQREKKMLIALAAVVICVTYYMLVMSPNLEKMDTLKQTLQETTLEYEKMKADIDPDHSIHREYKEAYAKAFFLSQEMFTNFDQERIILLLDDMLKVSELNTLNISFGEPVIVSLKEDNPPEEEERTLLDEIMKQYLGKDDSADKEQKQKEPEEHQENKAYDIKKMEITIQYRSTYSKLKAFLKQVEQNPQKITVSKIDMMAGAESNVMMGTVVLNLFYVPTFTTEDQKPWAFDDVYGKDNPFNYYAKPNTTTQTTENPDMTEEDFIITVKPISADLPSVMLLKSNDKEMKTHVYADNESIEPVEFQLLQEGSQYFYKYKTSEESYPQNYEQEKIAFSPVSDKVNIRIISSERNSNEDTSGIQLKILNQTDLECVVQVDYDDKDRKRVYMDMPFGDVTIKE